MSRQRRKCHLFFPSPEHFTFLRYKVLSSGRRYVSLAPDWPSFLYVTHFKFWSYTRSIYDMIWPFISYSFLFLCYSFFLMPKNENVDIVLLNNLLMIFFCDHQLSQCDLCRAGSIAEILTQQQKFHHPSVFTNKVRPSQNKTHLKIFWGFPIYGTFWWISDILHNYKLWDRDGNVDT